MCHAYRSLTLAVLCNDKRRVLEAITSPDFGPPPGAPCLIQDQKSRNASRNTHTYFVSFYLSKTQVIT